MTIFKLQWNEQYIVLLREFVTKIIFFWNNFNCNIHFLNIASVRWRPLLSAHSRKWRTSDKSSKWRLSSWTFPFCDRRCFSAVSHPQQYSIDTSDAVVPMNIEVPTKCPLSHNDRIFVLAIRLHSENPVLYRSALHGNWNALSLARMTNSPRQRLHSRLCCQIVKYFCRSLYNLKFQIIYNAG